MASSNNSQEATEQMFALVGRAITQWSFVEERLCSIFQICTSTVSARPEGGIEFLDGYIPMSVFYSVENFRSKLGMVDAAISSSLASAGDWSDEIRIEWDKLRRRTHRLSRKRNKLAHWTVLPAFTDEKLYPARLVPPIGSPGYYRATGTRPDKDTLKPVHLQHLELAFHLLSQKLQEFAFVLARREELFDKCVGLMARHIDSLDRLDPTRAERIRRALSSLG